jgi:hypothetical protein
MDKARIIDRLAEVVGPKYVTDEPFVLKSYSQDFGVVPGSMPDIVVRPRTSGEISGIMQIANEFKVPPDPWTPSKRRGRPSKETLRLIEQWCF